MNWGEALDVAKAIYSIALVVALALLARFAPLAIRVLSGLTEALTLAARALLAVSASADALARIESKIDQIHEATVPKPPSQ